MYPRCASIMVIIALKFAAPAIAQSAPSFDVLFGEKRLEIHMDTAEAMNLTISNINVPGAKSYKFLVKSDKEQLAFVDKTIESSEINPLTKSWNGEFQISATFLGNAKVYVELSSENMNVRSPEQMDLTIIRGARAIDHIFTGSVALLVSLLFISFGAALDLSSLKGIARRPIGPAIGFANQFLLMPLLSFGLGYVLFPDSVELHLGLFFSGVSPGGGASNIWTVILQGNINLSIAMTTIGNFAAFGMMPLWLFTLGRIIFERGHIAVPYLNIATFTVAFIVPLVIGIYIQKYAPRVASILVRLLKSVSMFLILFIVIFAIITNLYLFKLFSWQIIIAGVALPWLGYTLAWISAKILKQTPADALTIAIETGIQNTGVAIFLLRFSLPQPQADLTTVVPVCVALMTPLPLIFLYAYKKIRQLPRGRENPKPQELANRRNDSDCDDENPEIPDPSAKSMLG